MCPVHSTTKRDIFSDTLIDYFSPIILQIICCRSKKLTLSSNFSRIHSSFDKSDLSLHQ